MNYPIPLFSLCATRLYERLKTGATQTQGTRSQIDTKEVVIRVIADPMEYISREKLFYRDGNIPKPKEKTWLSEHEALFNAWFGPRGWEWVRLVASHSMTRYDSITMAVQVLGAMEFAMEHKHAYDIEYLFKETHRIITGARTRAGSYGTHEFIHEAKCAKDIPPSSWVALGASGHALTVSANKQVVIDPMVLHPSHLERLNGIMGYDCGLAQYRGFS